MLLLQRDTPPWRRRTPPRIETTLFKDLLASPVDATRARAQLLRARAPCVDARVRALWRDRVVDPEVTLAAFRSLQSHIFRERQPRSHYTVPEMLQFHASDINGVEASAVLELERLCAVYRRRLSAKHLICTKLYDYWHRPVRRRDGSLGPAPALRIHLRELCALGLIGDGDGDEDDAKEEPSKPPPVCSES